MNDHDDLDPDASAYAALATAVDDARWAFGTGFSDPLAGVDPAVIAGVDAAALADYCLMLGDDALICSHRLQEWITRLPDLEEETAVANIALDLLGQGRRLLARSAQARSACGQHGSDEDNLAFGRDADEWKCVRLVELPIEDFAQLVVRVLMFALWRGEGMSQLRASNDAILAAIAGQSVNELRYHRDWAAGWLRRLGDGTELSHQRTQAAVEEIAPMLPELFDDHDIEIRLGATAVLPSSLRELVWPEFMSELDAASIDHAAFDPAAVRRLGAVAGRTGRDGGHTEWLSHLLAEMQSVARAHPGATW